MINAVNVMQKFICALPIDDNKFPNKPLKIKIPETPIIKIKKEVLNCMKSASNSFKMKFEKNPNKIQNAMLKIVKSNR